MSSFLRVLLQAAEVIANAAISRLRKLTFVGLTKEHRRSAELLAATMQWKLGEKGYTVAESNLNRYGN